MNNINHLIHGDCLSVLGNWTDSAQCIFADPPDNIGLKYEDYSDRIPDNEYIEWLANCIHTFVFASPVVWVSYNAKWTFQIGKIVIGLTKQYNWLNAKPCVQTFTFGQHNARDLGNNHRPLLRLIHKDTPLYPDAVRVVSWRQEHGDKRANRKGRVPGDVFDFPRVTGNSHQRRSWHPTQLHEGLIERCIKLSTLPGDRVLDPFAGTGTTLRVCNQIDRPCTLIEANEKYCLEIAKEHSLPVEEWNP